LTEWESLFKKERLARRSIVRAEAVVAVCNERLDSATMQFVAMARATNPDLLERCFKIAPGKFIRRNLRAQCESTQSVIVPEIAKLETNHPCKTFGPKLDSVASNALASLDNRTQAFGNRQSATNDILEWKEGINALRTTTFAELLKIATAKGLPKSWVESFFRQATDDSEDSSQSSPSDAVPTP
jgi:hypothetical protein